MRAIFAACLLVFGTIGAAYAQVVGPNTCQSGIYYVNGQCNVNGQLRPTLIPQSLWQFGSQVNATPSPGNVTVVTTGGTPVVAFAPFVNGGYICNPFAVEDEGLGNTEPLYVNPTGAATLAGNAGTSALPPGQCFTAIPHSTIGMSVNAPSSGHKFNAVQW